MRNIVIITKVIVGSRPVALGMTRTLNIFKKSLPELLKENLNKKLTEENIKYAVDIDFTYDTCEEIIKKGASLLLISPYVKDKVDLSTLDKRSYYIMSEKEFSEGSIETIIEYINQL